MEAFQLLRRSSRQHPVPRHARVPCTYSLEDRPTSPARRNVFHGCRRKWSWPRNGIDGKKRAIVNAPLRHGVSASRAADNESARLLVAPLATSRMRRDTGERSLERWKANDTTLSIFKITSVGFQIRQAGGWFRFSAAIAVFDSGLSFYEQPACGIV